MQKPVAIQAPSRGRVVGAWIVQGLLAAAFLAAGGAKLAGVPMMVQIFDQIGMGQWFRIVTGLVEVIGAVALVVPGFAALGAAWLGATMFFAVLTHLFVLHTRSEEHTSELQSRLHLVCRLLLEKKKNHDRG